MTGGQKPANGAGFSRKRALQILEENARRALAGQGEARSVDDKRDEAAESDARTGRPGQA